MQARWIAIGWLALVLVATTGCADRSDTRPEASGSLTTLVGVEPPAPPPELAGLTRENYPVPGPLERMQAVGQGATMSPLLDRAFFVHDSFEPLRPPEPGDWLDSFPEPGQTYAHYVGSRPNRPDGTRSTIYLLPLGELASERSPDIGILAEYVALFFGTRVTVLPAIEIASMGVTERGDEATGNRQLLTTEILGYLAEHLPDDAYALIGLTMVDLYPGPSWNYVFGQASLRERVGVYSFARYHPAFRGQPVARGEEARRARHKVLERSLKVMAHEIGHMYGIQHCVYFQCVMNGSNSLAESDGQPMHLCPVDLRKLVHTVGLDPVQRYRELAGFYQRHDLDAETGFARARIQEIEGPGSGE